MSIISLSSDFGLQDSYVAEVKAKIYELSTQPVNIVDVSHQIKPFDIQGGSILISNAARTFPDKSIHLAVVDPGVGSSRRRIALSIKFSEKSCWFVGPDNGLCSGLLEKAQGFDAWEIARVPVLGAELIDLTSSGQSVDYQKRSATFDGRDVFAPVAAFLANGGEIENIAKKLSKVVRLNKKQAQKVENRFIAEIVYFDSFGNAASSLEHQQISEFKNPTLLIGQRSMPLLGHFQEIAEGHAAAIVNSQGLVEIVVNKGSAKKELSLSLGDKFEVFEKSQ